MKPFRLGTTSYIIPDDILPNVRYLAPLVDDIELVLFESEDCSNLPDAKVLGELKAIAQEHDLTYTVHFPLDVFPGSTDEALRRRSIETYQRIVDLTQDLNPFGYVLHLTPDQYGKVPSQNVPAWLEAMDTSLGQLTKLLPSRMLCAETLSYPFELVYPLVQSHDLSVALDIGHVWLMGYDAEAACNLLLDRTRIFHVHGVSALDEEGGKDHLGLGATRKDLRDQFLQASLEKLRQDKLPRVMTLEVFSLEHLQNSLDILQQSHAIVG